MAHELLIYHGFAPLNPMATMTLPFAWQDDVTHDDWIASDLPWIEVADAVLRLPGESIGADIETEHAALYGVPVFTSIPDLAAWRGKLAGRKQGLGHSPEVRGGYNVSS